MEEGSEILIKDLKKAHETKFIWRKEKVIKELQEFTKEIERVDTECLAGAFESWFEPSGSEGRTYEAEIDFALANRDKGYVPRFTYPALERGYLDENRKEETRLDLEGAHKAIPRAEEFPTISKIAQDIIDRKHKSLFFLRDIQIGEFEDLAEFTPYSPPSKELVDYAKKVYEEDLKPMEKKTELTKKLKEEKLTQTEMVEYVKYALSLLGAKDWKVEITKEKKAFSVLSATETVLIPEKEISILKFLTTLAHESIHIATAVNAKRMGLGTISLGEEADALQEGMAKLAENDVETMILGKTERASNPYYVLGMEKAHETYGNFWETFDYLVKIRVMELSAMGKSDDYIEKHKYVTPKIVVRRIFRGTPDLTKGGYVYHKDKIYLEGELTANKIRKEGLLGYFLAGKFDIATATFLIKTGVLPKEAVNLTSKVIEKIWENAGDKDFLTNTGWFRENYNPPYWRELGISDEAYFEAWKKGKTL